MASTLFLLLQRTTSSLAVLAAGALAFAAPARGDVIEVDPDGNAFVRTASGAVAWAAIDPTVAARGGVGELAVPDAALTAVTSPPAPPAFATSLQRAATLAGISPALLEAVVWQESRWRQGAISRAGALGLGQLMPATARSLGVDPRDPDANLLGAARYLRAQLDTFDNNVELALAAYNAGPARVGRVGRIPAIAETQAYVAQITARLANSTRLP